MINKVKTYCAFIIATVLFTGCKNMSYYQTGMSTEAVQGSEATGTFEPTGAPLEPPERIDVGKSCLVDIRQAYTISGTLNGSLVIDYRILVAGPCGSPAGTFDEDWIAYGEFNGAVNGNTASGKLSYTAHVKAGGEVEGHIILGQGLDGDLSVHGNFDDGKLSYKGWVK